MTGVNAFRWVLIALAVLTSLKPASVHAQLFSLAIDPVTPTTLYAGTQGVWRSIDGGATWNITGLKDREQYSLAIDQLLVETLANLPADYRVVELAIPRLIHRSR